MSKTDAELRHLLAETVFFDCTDRCRELKKAGVPKEAQVKELEKMFEGMWKSWAKRD